MFHGKVLALTNQCLIIYSTKWAILLNCLLYKVSIEYFYNKVGLVLQTMIKQIFKYYLVIGFLYLPLLANEKIDQCLKRNNCIFNVMGGATSDPTMSFVVLKQTWISFSQQDKDELKNILQAKIIEAKSNPDKFNDLNPKAPIYKKANNNISSIRSYSVILSDTKNNSGVLAFDNEIIKNW